MPTTTDTATATPAHKTIRRNNRTAINVVRAITNRYTLHTGAGVDADVTPNIAWSALSANPKARLQEIVDGEHYRITVNATTWYDLRIQPGNRDLGTVNDETTFQRYFRAEMAVATVALTLMQAVADANRSDFDADTEMALIAHGIATGEDANPLTAHGWLMFRIWTEGSDTVRAEAEAPVPATDTDAPAEAPVRTVADRAAAMLASVLAEPVEQLPPSDRVGYAFEVIEYLPESAQAVLTHHVVVDRGRRLAPTATDAHVAELVGYGFATQDRTLTMLGVLVHRALTEDADALYASAAPADAMWPDTAPGAPAEFAAPQDPL